jgi:hypothetical protein
VFYLFLYWIGNNQKHLIITRFCLACGVVLCYEFWFTWQENQHGFWTWHAALLGFGVVFWTCAIHSRKNGAKRIKPLQPDDAAVLVIRKFEPARARHQI